MRRPYILPEGNIFPFYERLLSQKHLLIAGASGSGKSAVVNGLIHTALARFPGHEDGCVQFIFIDVKGFELSLYEHLPHTLAYADQLEKAVRALDYAVEIIEQRNRQTKALGLRMFPGGDVYIVIDEFADLMTTIGKRIVPAVQRIAQIGRAARVHLILCTQCPLVEILPTKIKCNFDSVLALHTAKAQDSRNIIGIAGCESLPAHGSALYTEPGLDIARVTGLPLIPEDELKRRASHWAKQKAGLKGSASTKRTPFRHWQTANTLG